MFILPIIRPARKHVSSRIGWVIAICSAPQLLGASAVVVTHGDERCQTVRFPNGWQLARQEVREIEQLEFRRPESKSAGYVVAAAGSARRGTKTYGLNKFLIELRENARVRLATQREWETSVPAPIGERFRFQLQRRNTDSLVFRQREFKKSGPKWPDVGVDVRISPDERWIAVQSWQGIDYRNMESLLSPGTFFGTPSRFFVDVYDVQSGEQVIAV